MNNCLFCKIVNRDIPADFVYEDEDVCAFLDIHPVNLGHALVVPKQHCSGFLDCDGEMIQKWIKATQAVARAIKVGLGVEGLSLEQNEGAAAGQVVPHLHIHIIPRYMDDGLRHWPGKAYATPEEAQAVAKKIQGALR